MPARNHKRNPGQASSGEAPRFEHLPMEEKAGGTTLAEKAEQATHAVGAGMESLADTVRAHAPGEGMLANAGEAVADKLETSGRYLEEQGLSGMGDDLANMIRRNPIPTLLIGLGLGFIIARLTARR